MEDLGLTVAWMDARDFPREHIPAVIDLIRRAYNGGPAWFRLPSPPAEHLRWKLDPAEGGAAITYLRSRDDQIIGFTGTVRRRWLIGGDTRVGHDGIDLALDPDWQERGVPRAAQQARGGEGWHPDVEFALGWATHPAARRLALEQGRLMPGNPTHDYVRPLRPVWRRDRWTSRGPSRTAGAIIAAEQTRRDIAKRRAKLAARFVRSLAARRPARRRGGVTIRTIDRFDELAAVLPRALEQFDFVQMRTVAYLNWRYADRRAGPFAIRLAEAAGEPVGYAVTAIRDGLAYVADLLTLPGHERAAGLLVRDAVTLARHASAGSIRIRLPAHHPYSESIRRAGFFDLGLRDGELLNPRRGGSLHFPEFTDSSARVHLVYGDSDVV